MPVAIIPDISEQHCIGCALCVEICTSLGPDVLRVKPVEGWKRGKAFVFYPERCISDGACIGVCPTKAIFWMRPMELVDRVYSPLVSSRILPSLDIRQYRHHPKYIFLDRRQMLCLSSILRPALLLIHLDQELYKSLHTVHSQCSVVR